MIFDEGTKGEPFSQYGTGATGHPQEKQTQTNKNLDLNLQLV